MKRFWILILIPIFFIILIIVSLYAFRDKTELGLVNPWSNCGRDLKKAEKISGFSFKINLDSSKYELRVMKGIFEILYQLDDKRELIIRKAIKLKTKDIKKELAGVYDFYPIEKDVFIFDGRISMKISMDENNKIYIATTSNKFGYYSLYCKQGMSIEEIEYIYKKIEEFKDKNNISSTEKKRKNYSNCELGDLVGEDVERIYIKGFYIDYHATDYTKEDVKKMADSCFEEKIKSQYELDCCLRNKMFPETF